MLIYGQDSGCAFKGNSMIRKPIIILTALIIVGLGWSYYSRKGGTAPKEQHQLVFLDSSNINSLKTSFDEAHDSVRVLLLLSPT